MSITKSVNGNSLLERLDSGAYEMYDIGYRETMREAATLIRALKPQAERWQHVRQHAQSGYIRCKENEKVPVLVYKPDFNKIEGWQTEIDTAIDRDRGIL